jgi:hypothetical protein
MTTDLTPVLALAYLAELEPALAAVAIANGDGTTLAGEPALREGGEGLLSARSPDHVVLARVDPGALVNLVRHDLELVASLLSGS